MAHESDEDIAIEAQRRRLLERVDAIEGILLGVPVLVIEALLLLGMFVPYAATAEDGSEQEESSNLVLLALGAFRPDDEGETDASSVVLGVAFVALLIVVIASIVVVPLVLRRPSTGRTVPPGLVMVLAALLVLGTIGAWMVMGMWGSADDVRLIIQPALPMLTTGALLFALTVFTPTYRSIWED